uniref:Cold shock domain-containing protein C2-like n=1 Tax=Sinocyclocheilus anshuiensis TaxID=1608454 RepID=A0A671PAB1_9TELE
CHNRLWCPTQALPARADPRLPSNAVTALFCGRAHVSQPHCQVVRYQPSSLPNVATVRANVGPVFKGVCKNFSRSQGHGYIRPAHGGEDIFVHISDIEGEYVPVEGDEVTYKVCPVPPKNVKVQAVEVIITHLKPGTKHETWSGQIISS